MLYGKKFAMKKFYPGAQESFLNEKAYTQLENPHILKAVGWSTKSSVENFLLFPFSENGTLKVGKFISHTITFVIIHRTINTT